ncbi:hypothetical protein C0030_003505 [Candidatus Liberibacter solanacearum]|uniref:Uncharacterized protein n=1 Tax=Candidatus Liberibacter solanacearum TaxID=556287 RepID=A0A3R7QMK9_9HYPH|nr:hypothetical protein [Candidatus Liberibacter solanacearum]RPD37236.1 hypothetical protein C0030_003505 [Candidatus Liberibacter solanacearum]
MPTFYNPMTTLSTVLVKELKYIKACLDKDEFPHYADDFSLGHEAVSGSYKGRLLVLGGLVSNVPPYSFSMSRAEQVEEVKKRYSFLFLLLIVGLKLYLNLRRLFFLNHTYLRQSVLLNKLLFKKL